MLSTSLVLIFTENKRCKFETVFNLWIVPSERDQKPIYPKLSNADNVSFCDRFDLGKTVHKKGIPPTIDFVYLAVSSPIPCHVVAQIQPKKNYFDCTNDFFLERAQADIWKPTGFAD